ncbi:hypothetical protein JTE90_022049 [Oedothorax gibbosus]|uniref:Uncharacterized protein n=1 Tax=Oedothorax gibbosus TaxID=931172 RepID=A0AAV6V0Y7_9ARAC|nr:hypothetical protein JTE90_022049 [Oedothorax gibbosus]
MRIVHEGRKVNLFLLNVSLRQKSQLQLCSTTLGTHVCVPTVFLDEILPVVIVPYRPLFDSARDEMMGGGIESPADAGGWGVCGLFPLHPLVLFVIFCMVLS